MNIVVTHECISNPAIDMANNEWVLRGCALALCLLAACDRPQSVEKGEAAPEIKEAMARMTANMAVCAADDPDRLFAEMMMAHHQGAIDMAVVELRYGRNDALRRVAQEIIVDQVQEMDVMRLATGRSPRAPIAVPTVQSGS